MLKSLFKTKVFETMDITKKYRYEEILTQNNIHYSIDMLDLNGPRLMVRQSLGTIGKPKYVYSFWVKKKDADYAISLIRKIS